MSRSDRLPPPRAILFDWDNTLADNWAAIHGAMNATLVAMGQAPWTRPLRHVQNCAGLADLVAQLRVSHGAEL